MTFSSYVFRNRALFQVHGKDAGKAALHLFVDGVLNETKFLLRGYGGVLPDVENFSLVQLQKLADMCVDYEVMDFDMANVIDETNHNSRERVEELIRKGNEDYARDCEHVEGCGGCDYCGDEQREEGEGEETIECDEN